MAVTIKSAREIELMKDAGKILGEVHNRLAEQIVPGMSTKDIDVIGDKLIKTYQRARMHSEFPALQRISGIHLCIRK